MLRSLDLHDVLVLVDGRPELAQEIAVESPELQRYVRQELASLRQGPISPIS